MANTTYTQAGLGEGLNYINCEQLTSKWEYLNRLSWTDYITDYGTMTEASDTSYTNISEASTTTYVGIE